MTPQGASTTAVLVCQGRAVADGRLGVGRFADPVAVRLLDPAEREVVERVRAGRTPGAPWGMAEEMVLHTAATMVPRTVAIDDAVREHRSGQVVVLGAGLDARAWRMPELETATVFEVDHPASQADKQRRVAGLEPVAGRVVPVAVDLANDPLATALTAAGLDESAPTTWVWEGVVPYLTRDAVASTLVQLAVLSAPGSRLVVQYQQRSVVATTLRAAMRLALRVARRPDPLAREPWHTLLTPDELGLVLRPCGFSISSDHSLLELADGMDLPGRRDGSLGNGRVAVAERA
ncbi:class I SAM-dependent methyltransferase [Phycicoccus sp.]|uniref:class I SAM-dependent methyltransferase n=1 Tax=Phycicoccus sp. TaxID=1902410 RepID=UPI002B65B9B9|nr:class I SAM-dependent methyltransferase [Phycicoccus sp.]HMM93467.1 class I SAM-dependent methyltransferase [Phycicoccus sp.]